MSISISIQGDTRLFQKFSKVSEGLEDFKKPLEESGDLILEEVDKNFSAQGGRLGSKWKSLQSDTIAQRMREGYGSGPILQRSGKLKSSFSADVSASQVKISSKGVSYYKYHQLGEKPQPQRQMLNVNEKLKQGVVAVFTKHIKKLINE